MILATKKKHCKVSQEKVNRIGYEFAARRWLRGEYKENNGLFAFSIRSVLSV